MLFALLVGLHIVVSLILILVVLLQTGKSADLAGAFGGGGSQTAFGSRGAATFLSKMTTSAAVIFMITSFSLAILSARGRSSVLDATGVPVSGAPAPTADTPTDLEGAPTPSTGSGASPQAPDAGAPAGDAATADESPDGAGGPAESSGDE